eukprot:7782288-Lingulodinium_polyedra.AAC.1
MKRKGAGGSKSGILESKVWIGFKILSTGKPGYREWVTKCKNALSQARLGTRQVLEENEGLVPKLAKNDDRFGKEI